jgi:branched-chain amino acid transport system permease protein
LALPLYSVAGNAPYVLIVATRIMIYAVAALSLNLVLGFAGMVSFGHAVFLTVGAYSVAIPAAFGLTNGPVQLLIAISASALFGLATGAIALRTRGVAFIMITLAFAQMVFFLVFSLKQFGGDEGLNIKISSQFGPVALGNTSVLYWATLLVLVAVLYGKARLVDSTVGMVLRGIKMNEERMKALGFPTFRYKLIAYVAASVVCGVAGFLLANLTMFASPSFGNWLVSGDLMLMVALGGPGTVAGPLLGAAALLIVEDLLKRLSVYWIGILGAIIIVTGLSAKRGLWGLVAGRAR